MVLKHSGELRAFLLYISLIILLFFSKTVLAAAADIYTFSSDQEQQRFVHLTKTLRCLVCQNQSLADSDAALAKDLRHQIYRMIQENKSDKVIQQFLVSRYGEFILFSPPLMPATWLLWGFPVLVLLMAGGGLYLLRCGRI